MNVWVPVQLFVKGKENYQMSWQLYRALTGGWYSDSDRQLDDDWKRQNLQLQVLDFDPYGNVTIRLMSYPMAQRYRDRKKVEKIQREQAQLWAFYLRLQQMYGYMKNVSDKIFQLRKNLEESNGFHAR